MHHSDEFSDVIRRRALELAMREVLNGLEELSLAVAYAHAAFPLHIASGGDESPAASQGSVIPFPLPRRVAAG